MRKTEEIKEGKALLLERSQMKVIQEMLEEKKEINYQRIEITKIDLKEKLLK